MHILLVVVSVSKVYLPETEMFSPLVFHYKHVLLSNFRIHSKTKQYHMYKMPSNNVGSVWQLCSHFMVLPYRHQWGMKKIYSELRSKHSALVSDEGFNFAWHMAKYQTQSKILLWAENTAFTCMPLMSVAVVI
jgi:hypothetical protein